MEVKFNLCVSKNEVSGFSRNFFAAVTKRANFSGERDADAFRSG